MKVEGVLGVKPPGPDFVLVLPTIPPSGNEIKGMHWAAYRDLREKLTWLVRIAIGRAEVQHRDRLAHMTIKVFSNAPTAAGGRVRKLDRDNTWSGMKPLVDALKDQEIIKNDSDVWLDLGVVENRDPVEEPRTEIEITYNGKLTSPFTTERKVRAVVSKRGVDDGNHKVGVFSSPQKKTGRIICMRVRNNNRSGKNAINPSGLK